ncbi:MAG: GIY-YIG nuclease family protein [Dehalococcoidia bacterium]
MTNGVAPVPNVKATGLVIRTFLVDGQPDGLRTMELSNATVLGTFFPRPALGRFLERPVAERPGVYILSGVEPEATDLTSERVYIGEGDPVGPRLRAHGIQKDFWTQAAVFTSKDDYLTKTQIQFLEASLIQTARSAARAILDNANAPTLPNISEADRAEVETFFDHVQMLIGVAGHDFLRSLMEHIPRNVQQFQFRVKGAKADMVRTMTGYVVREGSTAAKEIVPSAPPRVDRDRQRLLETGALVDGGPTLLRFTKDTQFDSSSGAAQGVAGHSVSGRISWKLPDGRTLAEVEEAETEERVLQP